MFGGLGGALKDLGGKAGELLEKGKKDIEDLAAEKKTAASNLLESQVNKTKESFNSALGNAESQASDAKKAAIDSFDEEIKKAEGAVDTTVQQNLESEIVVDLKKGLESSSQPTPPADSGSSNPLEAGVKEIEKVLSDGIKQIGVTVDEKIKEVDHFVDEKREEVAKTVSEKANETLGSLGGGGGGEGTGAASLLGKAKGMMNF